MTKVFHRVCALACPQPYFYDVMIPRTSSIPQFSRNVVEKVAREGRKATPRKAIRSTDIVVIKSLRRNSLTVMSPKHKNRILHFIS